MGRLTYQLAQLIRAQYAEGGVSQHKLANQYGCDQSRISLILSEKIWKDRAFKNQHLRKHGHAVGGKRSKVLNAWENMKKRCTIPKNPRYHRYGGRGIKVCDRWMESFENFLADVGTPPTSLHSLDRINNDGNYEPGNVHWVIQKAQQHNRSKHLNSDTVRRIRSLAVTLPSSWIAKGLNIAKSTVNRILSGETWNMEATEPMRSTT